VSAILVEPWEDFLVYRSGGGKGGLIEVSPPEYPLRFTEEDVRRAYESVKGRYPQFDWFLEKRLCMARGRAKELWCWGRRPEGAKNPPVYLDPSEGRVYVDASHLQANHRLVCAVLHYRLTALGIKLITTRL